MCLAVPAKIISVKDSVAEVEIGGVWRAVSLDLVPEAVVDDYVLVHAGFAIQVVDEEEALKTLELFKEIMEHEHEVS
ncbi:MAG: HypC/HybG/HupF family hydrogenase formation chaperone [Firmicutes bacterium HGW-Firmicutes-14]|jgi:hydrogenase expression/formation protein HypC|nr:MAG: HypC/HybG/HupF family hydrogenase formation chaperone [Firmicutes bacterium HGW-Firmicutes-14]